ncbi:MAG TPA: phosphatase PAP2 family protein [Candidatus Enterenecus stercoripullorum]|nr:phosphatase PAP2 family protein [Candidatus Enterenecus stercoripullorum]
MPELIQQLDEGILLWIAQHLRLPVLNEIFVCYTNLGNAGLLFILAAIVLLCFRSTRRAGASAGMGMLLGFIITNLTIKPLISRARPWVVLEQLETLATSGDPNSFPSGHTCSAFAFGVAVAVVAPWKWAKAAAIAAAALMGVSRLYVGVHFPSDVLAGAVIGTVCGLLGAWITGKVQEWYRLGKGRG